MPCIIRVKISRNDCMQQPRFEPFAFPFGRMYNIELSAGNHSEALLLCAARIAAGIAMVSACVRCKAVIQKQTHAVIFGSCQFLRCDSFRFFLFGPAKGPELPLCVLF